MIPIIRFCRSCYEAEPEGMAMHRDGADRCRYCGSEGLLRLRFQFDPADGQALSFPKSAIITLEGLGYSAEEIALMEHGVIDSIARRRQRNTPSARLLRQRTPATPRPIAARHRSSEEGPANLEAEMRRVIDDAAHAPDDHSRADRGVDPLPDPHS